MRRLIAHGCVVVSIAMLCSGCTSYTTVPSINEHAGAAKQEIISSFSYEIDSPLKNSRLGKDAYALTKEHDSKCTGSQLQPCSLEPPRIGNQSLGIFIGWRLHTRVFDGVEFWFDSELVYKARPVQV